MVVFLVSIFSFSNLFNFIVVVIKLFFISLLFGSFSYLGLFVLIKVLLSSSFGDINRSEIVGNNVVIFLIFGVLLRLLFEVKLSELKFLFLIVS